MLDVTCYLSIYLSPSRSIQLSVFICLSLSLSGVWCLYLSVISLVVTSYLRTDYILGNSAILEKTSLLKLAHETRILKTDAVTSVYFVIRPPKNPPSLEHDLLFLVKIFEVVIVTHFLWSFLAFSCPPPSFFAAQGLIRLVFVDNDSETKDAKINPKDGRVRMNVSENYANVVYGSWAKM